MVRNLVIFTELWLLQIVGANIQYMTGIGMPQSKGPDQYATLTGPSSQFRCRFTISVDLKDRDRDASLDDLIAQGEITWDPRFQNSLHDKTLEDIVWGRQMRDGNVTVGYSVITYALSATIKVVMIKGDDEDPADVYGTIKAIISLGGGSSATVSLFDKSSSEYVNVCPENSIPLTRSVIPAPVNSSLIIQASLMDYDTFSSDDEIAEGSVHIFPIVATDPAKPMKIYGKYGEIEVSIAVE